MATGGRKKVTDHANVLVTLLVRANGSWGGFPRTRRREGRVPLGGRAVSVVFWGICHSQMAARWRPDGGQMAHHQVYSEDGPERKVALSTGIPNLISRSDI